MVEKNKKSKQTHSETIHPKLNDGLMKSTKRKWTS